MSGGSKPSSCRRGYLPILARCLSGPFVAEVQIVPDQGVDLDAVNIVKLLQAGLDLGLVGADVNDEDESVVLLHLLHGALGVQGVNNDAVGIETGLVGDGLAQVLGRSGQDQGLRSVERRRRASLDMLAGVGL